MLFRDRAVCSNRTQSQSSATQRRCVRLDDSSFTLNTPETSERDMQEAMLPAVVLILCSERGRSERVGVRVSTLWSMAVLMRADGVP
jgi:hypothetical protein